MANGQISVQFISNKDHGINDTSLYRAGITVGELISLKDGGNPANYTVRVNREAVESMSQVLGDGDLVTVAPKNIKGA